MGTPEQQELKARRRAHLVWMVVVQHFLHTVLTAPVEMEPHTAALPVAVGLIEATMGWTYTLHRWLRDNRTKYLLIGVPLRFAIFALPLVAPR